MIYAKTVEKTDFLIRAGVDVNARDAFGCTALMYAKTAEQTRLLIEAGADVGLVSGTSDRQVATRTTMVRVGTVVVGSGQSGTSDAPSARVSRAHRTSSVSLD